MTEISRWSELATEVKTARTRLGLRQDDLRPRGGPSPATVRAIEQQNRTNFSDSTFSLIEHALNWPLGLCGRILGGVAEPGELNLPVPTSLISVLPVQPPRRGPTDGLTMTRDLEEEVQVLGRGAVVTLEQFGEPDDSWWLTIKSTRSGDDTEMTVELPAAAIAPLAGWLSGRACRADDVGEAS